MHQPFSLVSRLELPILPSLGNQGQVSFQLLDPSGIGLDKVEAGGVEAGQLLKDQPGLVGAQAPLGPGVPGVGELVALDAEVLHHQESVGAVVHPDDAQGWLALSWKDSDHFQLHNLLNGPETTFNDLPDGPQGGGEELVLPLEVAAGVEPDLGRLGHDLGHQVRALVRLIPLRPVRHLDQL